jgi:hypothetical protein
VLERWTRLFTGPLLVRRYLSAARSQMDEAELAAVEALAADYRARLHELSWFMRTLNEHIARLANAEDKVSGRFWEGRFKSQALLDEKALLAALAYVDLNPVRAGIADTPETSDYTSVQERIGCVPSAAEDASLAASIEAAEAESDADRARSERELQPLPQAPLMPFDATGRTPWAVPFAFEDYLQLLDWTGRAIRPDKRGHIDAAQPKILARLGIDGEAFLRHAGHMLKAFGTAVGAPQSLVQACARRQTRYLRGVHAARQLFGGKQAA